VGDTVVLETNTSEKYVFEVTKLTNKSIIGESVEVPLDDIRSVRKKEDVTPPPPNYPPSTTEQIGLNAFGIVMMLLLIAPIFLVIP